MEINLPNNGAVDPSLEKQMLIICTFLGYGDVLYMTPFLKWINFVGYDVEVWACNCEPLYNNPHIKELRKLDRKRVSVPKHRKHLVYEKFGANSNNIHTIDHYSLEACRFILRPKEKDLIFRWRKTDMEMIRKLIKKHDLITNEYDNCNFVIISPSQTWPSRTLPLKYYKEIIKKIQANGDRVVVVGKNVEVVKTEMIGDELVRTEQKKMYPLSEFPGVIDFTDKLSFAELCALYSLSKMNINTENGNMVASCTNYTSWNLYISTLNPPEFRLPWRRGSQYFRTIAVKNEKDYFVTNDYRKYLNAGGSIIEVEPLLPDIDTIYKAYLRICGCFKYDYVPGHAAPEI